MKHKCSRCKLVKDVKSFSVSNGKVNKRCRDCYRDDHRALYIPKGGQTDDVRNCRECNREYAPKQRTESFFCSRVCKDKNRREKDKVKRLAAKNERLCVGCNETIPKSARVDKKWCSDECASKVRGHTMNTQRRIRTTEVIHNFKRIDIYERDGWICQLCKKAVNPMLSFPSPACASLDHVIPLSRGGSHQATNVQLAHLRCNTSRGNKVENISPRPPLILQQKVVFTISEASKHIGISKAVLLRGVENGKVPFIQDGKYGSRYLEEKVVAELILTGVEGSLRWRRENPKIVVNEIRSSSCPNCGKSFVVNNAHRKYCSATCLREAANSRRRQLLSEIKCSICGKAITNRHLNKKVNLCSQECVNRNRRIRKKDTSQPKIATCFVCKTAYTVIRKSGRPAVTCSNSCAVLLPRLRAREWHLANKSTGRRQNH
jgi:hypothetical protein